MPEKQACTLYAQLPSVGVGRQAKCGRNRGAIGLQMPLNGLGVEILYGVDSKSAEPRVIGRDAITALGLGTIQRLIGLLHELLQGVLVVLQSKTGTELQAKA